MARRGMPRLVEARLGRATRGLTGERDETLSPHPPWPPSRFILRFRSCLRMSAGPSIGHSRMARSIYKDPPAPAGLGVSREFGAPTVKRTDADIKRAHVSIAEAEAEAATSLLNSLPEPTASQKDAGNYKMGHCTVAGLEISIENPAGTSRRPEWPPLKHSYGYLKGTMGADGDHIDIFIGPRAADASNPIFVVDQIDGKGRFDEHKVLIGFPDKGAARRGYLANYEKGWSGLGAITEMQFGAFKDWIKDPKRTKIPVGLAPTQT